MICSTAGRMFGVSVFIPRGWILDHDHAGAAYSAVCRWNPRIRSKILISLELPSSTKCATPIFCRCWIYRRFRSMQKIVRRRIRSSSAAVRVPTIRSRLHHFLICSISARVRRFTLTLFDCYKEIQDRTAAAGRNFWSRRRRFRVSMCRHFMM